MTRLAAGAVRIFVRELGPAVDFYRGALGLPLVASGPGFAVFDAGSIELVVEEGDLDERGRPLAGRFTGLSLRSDDVQREFERLRALGVDVAGATESQDWGGILLTVADPAGNELQIAQWPPRG